MGVDDYIRTSRLGTHGGRILIAYTNGMKKLLMLAVGALLFMSPVLVLADVTSSGGFTGVTSVGGSSAAGNPQTVQNPLGGINSVCGLIKAILGAVIQIGIPIAVLFIVFAGFKFVLARGNSAKLQEARNNLMYTLIGIGIFLGAWLIATVIANTVNSLGAGSGSSQIISCN